MDKKQFSLTAILIIPFISIITLSVSIVGFISFINGRDAVNEVAHQLRSEITKNIEHHITLFLETPHQIIQKNIALISQGELEFHNKGEMERHFLNEVQFFETITSLYFGFPEGGMVGAGREGVGTTYYTTETETYSNGLWSKYAVNNDGKREAVIVQVEDFDARTRPWYSGAIEAQQPIWSNMYVLFSGHDLAIAASQPVYNRDGKFLGVISIDIFASHLSKFLQNLEIGKNGYGFIIERSGLLVASSTGENPFIFAETDSTPKRLSAVDSQIPTIQAAAAFLNKRYGGFENISGETLLEYSYLNDRQFLQVTPIQDAYGVDWLVVVVIPEADFMEQINRNNISTLILVVSALVFAIIAGWQTAKWISNPILSLNNIAQTLAAGNWDQKSPDSQIQEIGDLSQSFNDMVAQLHETLDNLKTEISIRRKVEENLKVSETQLKSAQNISHIGNWVNYVVDGKFIWSDEICRIFGFELDTQISLQNLFERVHPEDQEILLHQIESSLPYRSDYRIVLPDGKVKYIQEKVEIQRDEQGNLVEMWGTAQDITERKQAEVLLKNSEQKYKQLADELEERVLDRTEQLNTIIMSMSGREVRMAELKQVIKKLRAQLRQEGKTPIANDPLLGPNDEW
jgi:PAS domain S-box-containing protein